jgi:hypothetical protein
MVGMVRAVAEFDFAHGYRRLFMAKRWGDNN